MRRPSKALMAVFVLIEPLLLYLDEPACLVFTRLQQVNAESGCLRLLCLSVVTALSGLVAYARALHSI